MIFNDLLRKSLTLLEDKVEPVVVKGVLEPGEDRVKMRATDIQPIRALRNGSTVHISLDSGKSGRDNFIHLREIFTSYPGDSLVHIHIATGDGEAVIEVGDARVDVHDDFIHDIELLLGRNCLRLL